MNGTGICLGQKIIQWGLMERMSGYESGSDVLNAQFRNNSDLHVANMDRIRNEASAEFGGICRLVDTLHRRVEDNKSKQAFPSVTGAALGLYPLGTKGIQGCSVC